MKVIKTFDSKRNTVKLIENDEFWFVRKQFHCQSDFENECTFYDRLAHECFLVPDRLGINKEGLTIDMAYVDGLTLLEVLESLEEKGESREASIWLLKLCRLFVTMGKNADCHYKDVNLRNFLVCKDQLYCLDFEAIDDGDSIYIAQVLAYYLMYDPVQTPFKWSVVRHCLTHYEAYANESLVLEWVLQIQKRREKRKKLVN